MISKNNFQLILLSLRIVCIFLRTKWEAKYKMQTFILAKKWIQLHRDSIYWIWKIETDEWLKLKFRSSMNETVYKKMTKVNWTFLEASILSDTKWMLGIRCDISQKLKSNYY